MSAAAAWAVFRACVTLAQRMTETCSFRGNHQRRAKLATRDAELLKHALVGFSITGARETAWMQTQALWREKTGLDPFAGAAHETALADTVALVSHGILLPVVPPPAQ